MIPYQLTARAWHYLDQCDNQAGHTVRLVTAWHGSHMVCRTDGVGQQRRRAR